MEPSWILDVAARWTGASAEELRMAAAVAVVALVTLGVGLAGVRGRRRAGARAGTSNPVRTDQGRPRASWITPAGHGGWKTDPARQMHAVAQAGFETKPLLNREEAGLLPLLEHVVRDLGKGHRVMAQTSLGELVRPCGDWNSSQNRAAFAAINAKRLDFSIIDRFGHLKVAIEYQGSGHYHETSFMRDAVKREAVRKAGAGWLEVDEAMSRAAIRSRLHELLAV